LVSVITDCLGWTSLNSCHAGRDLLLCLWLSEDVRVAEAVVPADVVGGALSTQIAIRALIIDVKAADDIQRITMSESGHLGFVRCLGRAPKIIH